MSTLHHVTVDGWVENPTRPVDAIATFERTFARDTPTGVPAIDYLFQWKSPAISVSDLQEFLDQHGLLEMGIYGRVADVSWDMSWAT